MSKIGRLGTVTHAPGDRALPQASPVPCALTLIAHAA